MGTQKLTIREVLLFVNPPSMQHNPSLFYLRLLAEYGPPVNNELTNTQGRPLTKYEIRPMLSIYEDETNIILGKAGLKTVVHPKNLEILKFLERGVINLVKKRGTYEPNFTLETEVFFDDLSQAIEDNYKELVLEQCK